MIELNPDIKFIERLQETSGSVLKTCMQCGACTASCGLSSDQNVFPRKQMIMAAWGMKEQLMADPHVWNCHHCGDCSQTCPRGVAPGDVLNALRLEQIAYYSKPGFLARWMQKPAFLPVAVLFPSVMITLILLLAGTLRIPEGPVDYSAFFPHGWLNGSFTALFVLSMVGAIVGLKKFTRSARRENNLEKRGIKEVFQVAVRIMRHRDFNSCEEHKSRLVSHFLVFWGFILLLFVTFFAILSTIFWEYPLPFFNPIKIAGNIGAFMLIGGSSIMILKRIRKRNEENNTYQDWFFLISFWLLSISGMLVEGARFHNWQLAYHFYFFHLVMVWIIILYFPYTRFAHFLYRTTALIITR